MKFIYTTFGVDFCRTELKPMLDGKEATVICPRRIVDQLKKDLEMDKIISYHDFHTNYANYQNPNGETFVFYEFQSFPQSVKERILDFYATNYDKKIILVKFDESFSA